MRSAAAPAALASPRGHVRPASGSGGPRDEVPWHTGWVDAVSFSDGAAALRRALEAEPDGELLVVRLDACLVPLHTRTLPPQQLPLEPLDQGLSAAPRSEATLREVAAFRSGLAGSFGYPPRHTGTAPGWDEEAPHRLAEAAHRRAHVERREGPLDLPPVPTLHDAPGWQAAARMRALEQAVRDAALPSGVDDAADERALEPGCGRCTQGPPCRDRRALRWRCARSARPPLPRCSPRRSARVSARRCRPRAAEHELRGRLRAWFPRS